MSSEYPDVLGDLVDAQQRFEVNGVQYMMALDPPTIAPGELANLQIWLQSCWDMPLQVAISVRLPTKSPGNFAIVQRQTDVPLEAAEVGQVTIPIACATETEPGEYIVPATLGVKFDTRGLYVRSQKNERRLEGTLLNFATGVALSSTLGLGFVARTQPEQRLALHVQGEPDTSSAALSPAEGTPTYLSHWTVEDLPILGRARQYVNDQRLYLLPKLTRQALYLAFVEESRARLNDTNLPLEIGEAIFMSKILTFAVEYFLKQPDWQDVILVPAYSLAYRYNLAVNDPVSLIVRADYARIARLACSLSFGMLRQRLKRDPWTLEEQLAVTDLVTDRVERGGALPAEFLYLPLILGGLMIADQVQMPGEDAAQSLSLLSRARQKRSADLEQNPDITALLDRLTQLAQKSS